MNWNIFRPRWKATVQYRTRLDRFYGSPRPRIANFLWLWTARLWIRTQLVDTPHAWTEWRIERITP